MSEPLPPCPECASEFAYEAGALLACPMCGVVKVGTKVTGIRLISDGVGDHDLEAKVPGFGQMQLKSSVVKKVI